MDLGRIEFEALEFWKRCERLGLRSRAFEEARELGARNLGLPGAVEGIRRVSCLGLAAGG